MTAGNGKQIVNDTKDCEDLKQAVRRLESPSLVARASGLIGSPLEVAMKKLPDGVSGKINDAVKGALTKAAEAALWSLDNTPHKEASTATHKLFSAVSGAVGGAFGFASLFAELPVSTTLMMRAVADIARSEGFDLDELSTKQACIEVFAMGGNDKADDATEIGYYVTRGFTTETMKQLGKELAVIAAKKGAGGLGRVTSTQAAKWLAELVEKVAARFGIVITTKFAAQAVPIIGAITGAGLNTLYTDYYQEVAKGHFVVKRLEEKYGFEEVKAAYEEIARTSRK